MLNRLNLDDRTYQEIESDAIYHIPREYPEWTNYNPSDPGITLIQLFSWLKEVQQYHLSQLSDRKRRKYLRLLGMEAGHILPSEGAVSVEPKEAAGSRMLPLPRGCRFYAGDMAFETTEKEWIYPIRLTGSYMVQKENASRYYNIGNEFEKQMKLYPFGEEPEAGNQCYFVLDRPLSHEWKTDIYFAVRTEYEVRRNPIKEGFIPLAMLRWEYPGKSGWREMEVESDETYAFLQSGKVRLHIPEAMEPDTETGVWQIRVTLEENYYDVPPLIENVYLNEITVRQQYTFCDYEDHEVNAANDDAEAVMIESGLYLAQEGRAELYIRQGEGWQLVPETQRETGQDGNTVFLFEKPAGLTGTLKCRLAVWEESMEERRIAGVGNAFANQEYSLNIPDMMYDEFEILIQDRRSGLFVSYHKEEDFDNCTPEDEVFVLDPDRQKLFFGNGERGLAPDGEIRIIRLRTSQGLAGNIKADKIRECVVYPDLGVKQYKKTDGGRNSESLSQCFERFRREAKDITRGVTYQDYEELARKTPGLLILDSRVIPPTEWGKETESMPENQISIVVQPLSSRNHDGHLNERYRQNLKQVLERGKMLGTRIRILNPEYIGISVYAEIAIRAQYQDAEELIEQA
ncbi:MAG: hypothetical protein IJC59_00975, partial [Lachnospiraceae bacterium]|nr:hypothetical protein [Lachnospiraceae bacterium]